MGRVGPLFGCKEAFVDFASIFTVSQMTALASVILTDVALAGDNAVVVGMAAARLPAAQRRKAILIGVVAATVLRVVFALLTMQLLAIVGLTLAGGLLLVWVAWKLWRDLKSGDLTAEPDAGGVTRPSRFRDVVVRIVIADISMSLDNVLAVAGAAEQHTWVLVVGLVFSIALMGLAANLVARMLSRYPWVAYLGLVVIFVVALRMIWDGAHNVLATIS